MTLLSCDLRVAPPHGELKIGLGVEQAIKVSRNTQYKKELYGGNRSELSSRSPCSRTAPTSSAAGPSSSTAA